MSLAFRSKQYDISDSAYKHFDFPAVQENICRVGHLSTTQQEEGTGEGVELVCVSSYRVWPETAKGQVGICTEK